MASFSAAPALSSSSRRRRGRGRAERRSPMRCSRATWVPCTRKPAGRGSRRRVRRSAPRLLARLRAGAQTGRRRQSPRAHGARGELSLLPRSSAGDPRAPNSFSPLPYLPSPPSRRRGRGDRARNSFNARNGAHPIPPSSTHRPQQHPPPLFSAAAPRAEVCAPARGVTCYTEHALRKHALGTEAPLASCACWRSAGGWRAYEGGLDGSRPHCSSFSKNAPDAALSRRGGALASSARGISGFFAPRTRSQRARGSSIAQ